ncbi:MAG: MFS transporter [Pseudomonadota bacterium]
MADDNTASSHRWLILAAVGLGVSVGPLDTSVNIAFPAIADAFAIPVKDIQWVVICYVLTYASLLLGFGRLGDFAGHRRIFVFGLLVGIAGFIACSLADDLTTLFIARSLQGVGAALVLGTGPALATLSFPESERAKIIGIYTMLFAASAASGPLIGGALVATWGWSAVFWFRIPISILALTLVALWVRPPAVRERARFDLQGAVAVALAAASVLYAINRWQHLGLSPVTFAALAVGLLSVGYLVVQQRGSEAPLIPFEALKRPPFLFSNVAHALAQMASFSVLLVGPFYIVSYLNLGALVGGLMLAVSPIGSALAAPIGARLVATWGANRVGLLGLAFTSLGLGGAAWSVGPGGVGSVALCFFLQGIGLGLFQVANMDYVMGSLPRTSQGVAGSLTMLMRTIGVVTAAGGWALLYEYFKRTSDASDPLVDAFRGTFVAAGLVALIGFALIALSSWHQRRLSR